MGGKNKQRTKGNVRPSSSGRAAELLARERGSLPGFVGFESSETSSDAVYVPAVQGAEDIDSLVDAEFRVVLRKLSKRDSVTKLKAIQEFGSMCQEKDAETVKGVLPYWPRIYCKISGDHDRRVREATQQALQQLVLKVKRNLAPYLKSIMGHWLVAQCDTYSPAASAACTAFHAAFPCNKQAEALGFCKEEVLNILQDNLLKETPETLSDPQSVPMEERMAKYVRLVTSSLVAVKLLVSTLTPQDLDALSQRLAHLISHTKFWKYGKHRDSSQIRRAFFEAVVALCERTPQLVQAEAGQACPTVLLSIDDTDPGVLPMLWEAVRLILYCIPDCWVHVNAKKGVLPKLWLLLREGGHGLATDFYPNLLPFLSKLPHEVSEYPLQFYTTFFSALIQGLSTKRASRSMSESGAIVTAAMECLRFTMLQTITSSQGSDSDEEEEQAKESQQVCSMLLNEQLLPLVDCAMLSPILQNGPLFTQIKQMLLSWEKRATCPSEPHRSTFQQLLLDFWEGLQSLCVRLVDEVGGLALEGVAVLLQSMRGSLGATRGAVCNKKKAVCFADVTGTDRNAEENASHVHLINGDLEKLVCRLAEVSMVHVSLRDSDKHLCFLSVLLASFPDRRVFRVLLDLPDSGTDDHNPATSFLMQKVVVWLGGECGKDPGILVDMVFSALQCCGSQEEKTAILEHITQMDLAWGVLLQILQKGSTDLEAAAGWLKGSVLGGRLVGVAEELCTSGLRKPESTTTPPTHSHGWALVSLVLSQQQDGETLISKEHVVKILDRLHATLSDAKGLSDAGDMEPLVSFICDVASNFFSVHGCLLPPSAEELLLTVFQLCAQEQEVTHLSDSMLDKLKQALLAGILSLVSQGKADVGDGIFLRSAASWVHNQLLTSCFGVKSLQVLVSGVQSLVEVLVGLGQQGLDLMVQFVNHLMPTVEEWERMRRALPPQWVRCPLLSGRVRVSRSYLCMDRLSSRLPAHLSTSAVLGRTVYTALCATSKQEPELPRLPDLKHIAMEVLYALQWCEEMENCPTVVSEYCHLVQDLNVTRECVSKEMGLDGDLLQALFAMSVIVGGLWALTLGAYIQTLAVSSADLQNFCGSMQSLFPLTEARLNTLQVICPYLSADERDSVVSLATAALLSWQESDQHSIQSGMLNLAALHCGLEGGTCADEELLLAVVTTLMEWRNSKAELFLFSGDLNCVSAGLLSLNVEMMRFLCWLAAHCPTVLQEPQWDFLLCSVLAWLETATENTSAFWNPLAQLFVSQDCDLIVTLSEFFSAPPTGAAEHLPPKLTSEWDEFFMEGIHSRLLALLVRITEEFSDPDEPVFPMPVLRSVGEALRSTPVRLLTQNTLAPRFVADQRSSLPDPLQTLLNTLAPLLLFKARPVQITAFHILHKVMPQLPEYDTEGDCSRCDEDDGEEPSLSPPAALMTILAATEELLDNILSSVQVGEFAVVQPLSEEYSCILGYLLTWKLILTFFKASPSQLRVQYSMYLRKSHLLNKLLLHLFRLMPEIPVLPEPGGKTFFTESLDLPVRSCSGLSRELPHLACSVYYTTLKDLPAMVRLWWNGQDKRVFSTVDKFTSKYVSSVLSSQELAAVHVSTQTFEYMTVKARTAAREVIATYSVDDIFIELVIQLPQNYPLGSISVESGRRVGVAVQQWRNWLLQLSTYLTHQNGSIMEGLALWKNNVDKRFEGVEDCMICFSVIHGSNYSLPKKACRTCKKKFHSACLYKWFTSSNKSTCPLCRETFF